MSTLHTLAIDFYGQGKNVQMSGSWDNFTTLTPLQQNDGIWTFKKKLAMDQYYFKFIVDGNQTLDNKIQIQEHRIYGKCHKVNMKVLPTFVKVNKLKMGTRQKLKQLIERRNYQHVLSYQQDQQQIVQTIQLKGIQLQDITTKSLQHVIHTRRSADQGVSIQKAHLYQQDSGLIQYFHLISCIPKDTQPQLFIHTQFRQTITQQKLQQIAHIIFFSTSRTQQNTCAQKVLQMFANIFKIQPNRITKPKTSLRNSIQQIQYKLQCENMKQGAGLLVVYILGNKLYLANIGNNRAIIGSQNYNKIQSLTYDHTVLNLLQQQLIHQRGGKLCCQKIFNKKNKTYQYSQAKLYPSLSTITRSLGDCQLKIQDKGLSSVPDVFGYTIKPEDNYLLIGNRSLFNVLQNQQIKSIVKKTVQQNKLINNQDVKQLNLRVLNQIFKGMVDRQKKQPVVAIFISLKQKKIVQ